MSDRIAFLPSPRSLGIGATLRVDQVTVELVRATRVAGVECILLKGASFARWLYQDRPRPYIDADLLVSPESRHRAEQVLLEFGFKALPEVVRGDPSHARAWSNGWVAVDLHDTLYGVGVSPSMTWEVLRGATETMLLLDETINILDAPGRALHVALHAAQHGSRLRHPLEDLARAVAQVSFEVWEGACSLAARLGATMAFAAGLRLVPEGRALAARLGLEEGLTTEIAIRTGPHPRASVPLSIEWFATMPGARAKVAYGLRKVFPPTAYMRAWSRRVGRGRSGLVAVYLWRPVWIAIHLIPGLRAWRQARRQAAQLNDHPSGTE